MLLILSFIYQISQITLNKLKYLIATFTFRLVLIVYAFYIICNTYYVIYISIFFQINVFQKVKKKFSTVFIVKSSALVIEIGLQND